MPTDLQPTVADEIASPVENFSQPERPPFVRVPKLRPSALYRRILGVQFFVGNASQAVQAGLEGGLVVAPAAPSLLSLRDDRDYREALVESDLAITDSGFMVMLWNTLAADRIPRLSGLEYLKLLLLRPEFRKPGATFWVMPSEESMRRNVQWLQEHGVCVDEKNCYVAPKYPTGTIRDNPLLERLNSQRPAHVIIGVGGGTQERLGLFLKRNCDFNPGIHCVGAAIGFLTGDQVSIPEWADHYRLGWFFRCASDPRRFVPRYLKAFGLAVLLWRYRDQLPV